MYSLRRFLSSSSLTGIIKPTTGSQNLRKCCQHQNFLRYHHCWQNNHVRIQPFVGTSSLLLKRTQIISLDFHTSRTNCALPPLIWFVVRPILKLGAILFGRGIRKWWKNLPKDKKIHFKKFVRDRIYIILGSCVTLMGASYAYYLCHLEEHPITKRKRFVIFNHDQIMQVTALQIALEAETHHDKIVGVTHPAYRRVERVASRILDRNKDLPQVTDRNWSITVVKSDRVDAFVFPNGHIFVFTGVLDKCSNDDQLAIILGHEIAHTLLGHVGEKLSNAHIAEMLLIIPLVVLWSVFPDTAAFIFQVFTTYCSRLLVELPYSRSLEKEADEIGLLLAAKGCFDVRQATVFWKKMSEADPVNEHCEFLSSHPSHEHRREFLQQQTSVALKLRALCKCPDLV